MESEEYDMPWLQQRADRDSWLPCVSFHTVILALNPAMPSRAEHCQCPCGVRVGSDSSAKCNMNDKEVFSWRD